MSRHQEASRQDLRFTLGSVPRSSSPGLDARARALLNALGTARSADEEAISQRVCRPVGYQSWRAAREPHPHLPRWRNCCDPREPKSSERQGVHSLQVEQSYFVSIHTAGGGIWRLLEVACHTGSWTRQPLRCSCSSQPRNSVSLVCITSKAWLDELPVAGEVCGGLAGEF